MVLMICHRRCLHRSAGLWTAATRCQHSRSSIISSSSSFSRSSVPAKRRSRRSRIPHNTNHDAPESSSSWKQTARFEDHRRIQSSSNTNTIQSSTNITTTRTPGAVHQAAPETTRIPGDATTRSWQMIAWPIRYRYPKSAMNALSGPSTTAAGTSGTVASSGPLYYTRAEAWAICQRLPMWLVIVVFGICWDQTAPYKILTIRGPSMLPTMAADHTDIWLCRNMQTIWQRTWRATWKALLGPQTLWFQPRYRVGDLIGFAPPPRQGMSSELNAIELLIAPIVSPPTPVPISCKRIVGLPGDSVQRYGQYVHLYMHDDPYNLGMVWPIAADESASRHDWIDRSCPWDYNDRATLTTGTAVTTVPQTTTVQGTSGLVDQHNDNDGTASPELKQQQQPDPYRTLIVPEGHVWVEADCPGLGIDSRHFGPIPISWIRGKITARLWPPWSTMMTRNSSIDPHNIKRKQRILCDYRRRPHPIPLDNESLNDYNVHRIGCSTTSGDPPPLSTKSQTGASPAHT